MGLFEKYNLVPHNFTENHIELYENVFSTVDCDTIQNYLKKPNWMWGHTSKMEPDWKQTTSFWCMNLTEEKFFTQHLFNKIQNLIGQEFILERCYANGNTFGLPGQIHQDGYDEKRMTFLYYANNFWSHEFGGKTAFIFDDSNKNKYILPEKNRAVYFPGMIPHYAEEITRLYAGLRTVIAWKLEKK